MAQGKTPRSPGLTVTWVLSRFGPIDEAGNFPEVLKVEYGFWRGLATGPGERRCKLSQRRTSRTAESFNACLCSPILTHFVVFFVVLQK